MRKTWLASGLCALVLACGGDDGGTATDAGTGSATTSGSTNATSSSGATDGGTDSTSSSTSNGTSGGSTGGSSGTGGGSTGGGSACGPIVTFETGKTPVNEIHVEESGTDDAGCGAAASPCASIEHAASLATPGTAVVVHAGTYAPDGYIANLAGTADDPIWIGGAAGEATPVVSGGGQAFQLSQVRYLVVHDLEITGATANGINCDDGANYDDPDATRYVVFRDLDFHDVGVGGNQDCLKLSGLDDFWVLDSSFQSCGAGGSGVDHVGCHDGLLAGNTFRNVGSNAIQAKGGAANLEIRGNTIIDAGDRAINIGGSTGFEFFRPPLSMTEPNAEATNIEVVANVIVGSDAPLAFVGCDGCRALNNTIIDPGNWIIRILQETTSTAEYEFVPARNGLIQNNLLYFDRSAISTYINIGGNTDAPSFTFTTNLWYAHDDPGQSNPAGDLPSAEAGGIYGMDPALADVGGSDYSISAASPASGAGTPHASVVVDHVAECYGEPPSIGAREVTR